MMRSFLVFLSLILLSVPLFARNLPNGATAIAPSKTLQIIMHNCYAAVSDTDYLRCPSIKMYKFDSSKNLHSYLTGKDAPFQLQKVTAKDAQSLLLSRVEGQIDSTLENAAEGDDDLTSVIVAGGKKLKLTAKLLGTYIRSAEKKGATVFADSNAYSAPSVNAAVIVLFFKKDNIVTVIMHSDSDG